MAVLQAETQPQDTGFTRGQGVEQFFYLLFEQFAEGAVGGIRLAVVFDKAAQFAVVVLAYGMLKAQWAPGYSQHPLHLARFALHHLGDFFHRGLAAGLLLEIAGDAIELPDTVGHMHRHADRAPLIGDGARDRLPDPPGGVGAETVAAVIIEFLHRFHQAEVAFLDQVQEGYAARHVFLGNGDNQPRIGFYQMVAGIQAVLNQELPLGAALVVGRLGQLAGGQLSRFLAHRQLDFLLCGQQRDARHFLEVQADRVAGGYFTQVVIFFVVFQPDVFLKVFVQQVQVGVFEEELETGLVAFFIFQVGHQVDIRLKPFIILVHCNTPCLQDTLTPHV